MPTVLGDRQRRQNVPQRPDGGRLEHKCRKERTRRDKMKSSIMRLKDILRDSVNMVSHHIIVNVHTHTLAFAAGINRF